MQHFTLTLPRPLIILSNSSSPNPIIDWLIPVITAFAAIIVAYKFFIRRPDLKLQSELESSGIVVEDGIISTHPKFYLENSGIRFAEDVYIEVSLPDWNFGEGHKSGSIEVDVSVQANDEQEDSEEKPGLISALYQYLIQSIEQESDNKDEKRENQNELIFKDSVLDVRNKKTTYIAAAGEVNQIIIDDIIYDGAKFKLFSAKVELERFRNYEIKYEIGCRTYGPKEGSIEFEVGYDEIKVYHNHPKPWWSRFHNIANKISFAQDNDKIFVTQEHLITNWISFHELLAIPVAVVRLSDEALSSSYLVTVKAKATMYLGEKLDENIIGTLNLTAYALSPGDAWKTIPSSGPNRLKINSSYEDLNQIPLRFSPHKPPYPLEVRNQLKITWSTEYNIIEEKGQNEIQLTESEMNVDSFEHSNFIRIKGTIKNKSHREQSPFIIVKLYCKDRKVVDTPYKQVTVAGKNKSDFTVQEEYRLLQFPNVIDYEIDIVNSLGHIF